MSQPAQVESVASGVNPLASLLMMGDKTSDRMRKLIGSYMVGMSAYRIGRKWYDKAKAEAVFTVSVPSTDDIYPELQEWLLDQIPERQRRAVEARSGRRWARWAQPMQIGEEVAAPALNLFYDSRRTQKVDIDGQSVTVSLEQASFDFSKLNTNERFTMEDRIVFTCHSTEARTAVVAFLRQVVAQRAKNPPRLFSLRWGSEWARISDVANRSLESVVLRTGQRERLVGDLERFLGQEADYARLGVPWHRGYLFTGPPGTGKSSIAAVLASHFGLDIYFLPLGSVKDDADLVRIFAGIQPRSMLVLEDVDVLHASRSREEDSGVTMAGLLNCLDGMLSPSGMVAVMTSNHPEVLDEALTRPGRVDLSMEFGYLDADQLKRLLSAFLGRHYGPIMHTLPSLTAKITPADVVDVLKRHLDEPYGAAEELTALVSGTR